MRLYQALILISICLLYFTTRLYHIESFPPYMNDESFYHQLSLNIKEGKFYQGDNNKWYVDIYGLKYTPHEHPPLHFLLTTLFLNKDIISIRIINIFLNFIIMILIFLILNKLININTGLLGTLTWTLYPYAIYMNRVNFPQTSLALFTLCSILAMIYNKKIISILSISCAALSEYCGAFLIIPYFIKFKKKGLYASLIGIIIGICYGIWAIDKFVIEQFIPTIERFVYLWQSLVFILIILIISLIFYRKINWHLIIDRATKSFKRIPSSLWISLYFYLLIYYLIIQPLNIYKWYTFGVNIFYIGIVGLLLINDKTLFWSFTILQLFMLIINRGDHISIMIQPLIIIGFAILTYKILNYPNKHYFKLGTILFLIFTGIILLIKVYIYIPTDSEDLDSFDEVLNYANTIIDNDACVMSMTKFTTRLNTNCKSDILIPCAYVHGDCVYRHFHDKSIFNYNVSYYNMKYVIVKEQGLTFLKQWGSQNNKSMFATADTIMNWRNISVNGVTIFINPTTNLTYGMFGEHRLFYKNPTKEEKSIITILFWNETNVSGYTIYRQPQ